MTMVRNMKAAEKLSKRYREIAEEIRVRGDEPLPIVVPPTVKRGITFMGLRTGFGSGFNCSLCVCVTNLDHGGFPECLRCIHSIDPGIPQGLINDVFCVAQETYRAIVLAATYGEMAVALDGRADHLDKLVALVKEARG